MSIAGLAEKQCLVTEAKQRACLLVVSNPSRTISSDNHDVV